jgi:hypothetical protein
VTSFIKRVVLECEADWIFFQLEYLQIFDEILSDKNSFSNHKDLHDVSLLIVERFFKLFKTNSLLPVEALFRVREKRVKNLIVSNYREVEQENYQEYLQPEENFKNSRKVQWSVEEDETLIKNFSAFQGTASCFEHLSNLIPDKEPKDVKKRVKQLKLEKGAETAKQVLKGFHADQFRDVFQDALEVFEKFSKEVVLKKVLEIVSEFEEFCLKFPGCEFAVVPRDYLDFDLFADRSFCNFVAGLGFAEPKTGEWCWRVIADPKHLRKVLKEVEDYQPPVYEGDECTLENGSLFLSQVMGVS